MGHKVVEIERMLAMRKMGFLPFLLNIRLIFLAELARKQTVIFELSVFFALFFRV